MQVFKQSAPGVSKHVKKTLHHDKFKDVLKSKSPLRKLVTSITSDNHIINITESIKTALSAFDDKRYYLNVTIRHSLICSWLLHKWSKTERTLGKSTKVLYCDERKRNHQQFK